MYKYCPLILLLALLNTSRSLAQEAKQVNVIPPSPNASSLGKFADIPVSYYTGTPQVSVPLWEVKGRSLSLPVSLSYHAGGVKIEETAAWTGIGWALNAGGVISRSVHGLPDDKPGEGYFRINQIPTDITIDNYNTFLQYANGEIDGQPDVFFFSFGGRSGKFVIDKSGKVFTIPEQRLKITYTDFDVDGNITSWTIVDESGVKYVFDQAERTETDTWTTDEFGQNPTQNTNPPRYNSSWYLSSITSAQNDDNIQFTYSNYDIRYEQKVSQTRYERLAGVAKTGSNVLNKIRIPNAKRISKITYASGEVQFNPGGERCDLNGDKVLSEIVIVSKTGAVVKKYRFAYSYFDKNGIVAFSACTVGATHDIAKRLRLDAVKEYSATTEKNPYQFEYEHSVYLPNRFSNAQDHWGYFNGKISNTSLIPALDISTTIAAYYRPRIDAVAKLIDVVTINKKLTGANRAPQVASAVAGMLRKVTYPTGGYTAFTYQLHDCESTVLPNNVVSGSASLSSIDQTDTKPFTIGGLQNGVYVNITPVQVPCNSQYCPVDYTILNSQGSAVFGLNPSTNAPATVYLPKGTYTIKRRIYGNPVIEDPYDFLVSWQEEVLTTHKPVGGLRIAQILDYDPVSQKSIVKKFEYTLEDGLSSGSVINVPNYGYYYDETASSTSGGASYFVRSTNPNYPLGLTQGSPVGYSRVSVFYGEGGINGKSVYEYYSPKEFPDIKQILTNNNNSYQAAAELDFPFAPPDSREWKRGLLRTATDYRKNGTAFAPVKQTVNHYAFFDGETANDTYPVRELPGVVAGFQYRDPSGGYLAIRYYKTTTAPYFLSKTVETLYDQTDPSKAVTTETNYTYSSEHLQLTESLQSNSDGSQLKNTFTYVADFQISGTPTDPALQAMQQMQTLHMIKLPVEKRVWHKPRSNTNFQLVTGEFTKYKNFGSNQIYPNEAYRYRAASPVANPSATSIANGSLQFDIYNPVQNDHQGYELVQRYSNYSTEGNLLEVSQADDIPVTYLWGYNHAYPVAEINNATYAEVVEVLGQTVINELNTNPGTDAQVRQKLQPLYTHQNIQKAMVTTFTYNPLVGMTSQTDPSGTTTYFEYDPLQRLQYAKDFNGNIIKHYVYHYKGQD